MAHRGRVRSGRAPPSVHMARAAVVTRAHVPGAQGRGGGKPTRFRRERSGSRCSRHRRLRNIRYRGVGGEVGPGV